MNKKDVDTSIIRDINYSIDDLKIDATDVNNLSKKVLDEKETRRRLLTHARMVGCEKDMLLLFAKADKDIKNCTNEQEKQDIGKFHAVLIYKLLGGGGTLYVDGQLVCDDRTSEEKK